MLSSEILNHLIQRLVERNGRLPADGGFDLLDARHAPLHVLKPLLVSLVVGHGDDRRGAARAGDHALCQLADQTPPNTPSVFATGKPDDASYVEVSWSAIELDSSITGYRYTIGAVAGATDIVNWTTTTSNGVARSGIGLVTGQQYWSAVQAQNVGGCGAPSDTVRSPTAGQQTLWRIHLPLVMK